ncbi:MAG: hypothetical protein KQH63_22290, partial [Desulfobulbaceae bacterium]|nr:hypothetical protein [Desulfobulbaceae bacterium]
PYTNFSRGRCLTYIDTEGMEARKACKTMVGILALAHRTDCERQLGEHLQQLMSKRLLPSLLELQQKFEHREQAVPDVTIKQPAAMSYNSLLISSSQEVH